MALGLRTLNDRLIVVLSIVMLGLFAMALYIPDTYTLIENDTYHAAVNYLKGRYSREEFLKTADTLGKYAVAMKDHFEGRNKQAIKIWNELTDAGPRGYWPAEAELLMISRK